MRHTQVSRAREGEEVGCVGFVCEAGYAAPGVDLHAFVFGEVGRGERADDLADGDLGAQAGCGAAAGPGEGEDEGCFERCAPREQGDGGGRVAVPETFAFGDVGVEVGGADGADGLVADAEVGDVESGREEGLEPGRAGQGAVEEVAGLGVDKEEGGRP